MKKYLAFIIGILVGILLVIGAVRLLSGEDDWLCQNGQWIKHGQPSGPPPEKSCD